MTQLLNVRDGRSSGLTHGPGNTPIGSAFTAGGAVLNTGAPTGACASAHYCYTLTVESSTVTFSSVQFEVKNSAGSVFANTVAGKFSILAVNGTVVASQTIPVGGVAMTGAFSSFTYVSASTPLTSTYTIVVDLGVTAVSPAGAGLQFVTIGIGSYSGSTSTALP